MKFSASTVLLAAALGVSAHPHGAAHPHARRDTNLEVRDTFFKNAKPTTTVYQTVTVNAANNAAVPTTTSAAVAVAAATSTSKAAAATSSASSGTIGGGGSYSGVFSKCTGTSKRATTEEIEYPGNVGSPYGCNLQFVEQSEAKNYQYISVLENAGSEKQVCACFLKKGPTGLMDGFWGGKQVLDFSLAAGEAKYLAVQDASIGGCSCGVGSLPTTSFGQISGTWLEWEFGSGRNIGFTGADASSLVPEADGQTFQGLSISQEGSSTISVIYPNGDGCNAFPKGTKQQDGHGFNIGNTQKGGDAVRLHVKWGTTGSLSDCPKEEWKQVRGA